MSGGCGILGYGAYVPYYRLDRSQIRAMLGQGGRKGRRAVAGYDEDTTSISMVEVHDCFTTTELVLMEDLGFSQRGQGWKHVLDGFLDLGGGLPVNPDGGLKSFGHPIGASGLRMLYETWLQRRGQAGERQLTAPKLGLTQNLGGQPGACVTFISIVGSDLD